MIPMDITFKPSPKSSFITPADFTDQNAMISVENITTIAVSISNVFIVSIETSTAYTENGKLK